MSQQAKLTQKSVDSFTQPAHPAEGTECIDFRQGDVDLRQFRRALGRFATGVTVITTRHGHKREGLTANSFSSVSLEPPLVLWSLRLDAPSLESFRSAGCFAINVLSAEQQALSAHFATPAPDKFAGIDIDVGLHGCPLLKDCLAYFECRIENEVVSGDHVIFIGRVLRARHRDGEPLLFNAGAYCIPCPLPA